MWIKKQILYKTDSYSSVPYAFHIGENVYRIFYTTRNFKGQSLPYYVDSIVKNGNITLLNNFKGPILDLGEIGTFDDNGITASCIVKTDNLVYMYYIGWNVQVSVSYRLSIGLAISYDNGNTFVKYSEGPLLDRDIKEPYFNTAPFVIKEDEWKMWYVSCTKWIIYNNKPEPIYNIKIATSDDGIFWKRKNTICIDYTDDLEAIGRPCVIKTNDYYEMFFSYRKSIDYRENKKNSYKIGKAFSLDGIKWDKKKDLDIIKKSNNGWDSKMTAYSHVFDHDGIRYMIYNGNHFGKNGFGYAVYEHK